VDVDVDVALSVEVGVKEGSMMDGGNVCVGRKEPVAVLSVTVILMDSMSRRVGAESERYVMLIVVVSDSGILMTAMFSTEERTDDVMVILPDDMVKFMVAFERVDVWRNMADALNRRNI